MGYLFNKTLEERELQRNGEGYPDPTCYQAIKNVEGTRSSRDDEYKRYRDTIGCILRVCELAGFHVEEKIILKDERTGKVYR